jgi:3-hydroxyacyl-CoA dehydrogenase/enoyl-CoA hydratase/3-hydroxybutyryl-CoA epimerase
METLMHPPNNHGLRLVLDKDVALIEFDVAASKVNTLGTPLMTELERLLDELRQRDDVRSVILISGKENTFIAGADLDEIEALRTAEEAREAARFGQRVFEKIETLGKPVVAAVHGTCLGGGCEMILACHHRILTDHPSTKVGLPEVKLGILPGFGGTQRLPRVVGLQAALDMILTGRNLDAQRAHRIGLADRLAYPGLLRAEALRAARELAESGRWRVARPTRQKGMARHLDRTGWGHRLVLHLAAKGVRKQTQGHYPAPLAALESVRNGVRTRGRAYEREAELLGQLAMSDVSRNLVHLFRLTEHNKRVGSELPQPYDVLQIAVVGAGVMGGGIAYQAAMSDLRVRMKDIASEPLLLAFRTARELMQKMVRRRRMDMYTLRNRMAHISATTDYTGFRLADVVIEAVVENMDIKKTVLRELEKETRDSCVLATNTSALSVTEMASAVQDPSRVLGMHFFNPVHRMPLVEIITTEHTNPRAVSTVLALARRLRKTPVLVKDGPGFLVNRILAPYMNESSRLFEEGQDLERLEKLFKRYGMPMGPFELLDEIGTDVAAKVGDILHRGLGERMAPASLATMLMQQKRLGRKNGLGVYRYAGKAGRERKAETALWKSLQASRGERLDDDILVDRVIGLMLNEAARCLEEGIVDSAADLDLALVFGIGFPPFRGGLLRDADARGIPAWVERLRQLEERFGSRFAPCQRLLDMAARGETFGGETDAASHEVSHAGH